MLFFRCLVQVDIFNAIYFIIFVEMKRRFFHSLPLAVIILKNIATNKNIFCTFAT
jgi:hypothetical protein